jgi:hypothetical protein
LAFFPLPFSTATINNGAFTGSLGSVYRPLPTLIFKMNFGTAFRAPNVDDIGKIFDSEPGAVVVPNPNLKAEYAYNLDASVAKIFGDKLKINQVNGPIKPEQLLEVMISTIFDLQLRDFVTNIIRDNNIIDVL